MNDIYAVAKTPAPDATLWTEGALIKPEPWVGDPACAEVDPELFFPDSGENPRAAKAICAGCPVAAQCLDYAIRTNQTHGIWAGKAIHQVNRMREGRPYRRVPTDLDKQIRELNAEGWTDAAVARHLKVGASTVSLHRTQMGIPRVPPGGAK